MSVKDIQDKFLMEIEPQIKDGNEDDFALPALGEKGYLLFKAIHIYDKDDPEARFSRYVVEDYTGEGGGPFWLMEDGFVEYWISDCVDITEPGIYRIDGLYGTAYKSSWEYEEVDVEYNYDKVTKVSDDIDADIHQFEDRE